MQPKPIADNVAPVFPRFLCFILPSLPTVGKRSDRRIRDSIIPAKSAEVNPDWKYRDLYCDIAMDGDRKIASSFDTFEFNCSAPRQLFTFFLQKKLDMLAGAGGLR
jgi:hypothetical protein